MLKFDLLSDLHIDLNKNFVLPEPNPGSEILVIAGDLAEINSLVSRNFRPLVEAKQAYKEVIYVAGNHEYYSGSYFRVNNALEKKCQEIGVRFLQKNTFSPEGSDVVFIGGTLFTDMNNGCDYTMEVLKRGMADFHYITYEDSKPIPMSEKWDSSFYPTSAPRLLKPADYLKEFRVFMEYFQDEVNKNKDKKVVLVTHHAMSESSVMQEFSGSYYMNGGYRSRCDEFFLKNPQIKVHCHGHMHAPINYQIGETIIHCNPYGYERYGEPRTHYKAEQIEV